MCASPFKFVFVVSTTLEAFLSAKVNMGEERGGGGCYGGDKDHRSFEAFSATSTVQYAGNRSNPSGFYEVFCVSGMQTLAEAEMCNFAMIRSSCLSCRKSPPLDPFTQGALSRPRRVVGGGKWGWGEDMAG